jgi:hypothetical protein
MTWDGEERRRGVSNDWIERDRLLSEVHSDMKHMLAWAKEHNDDDNTRFKIVGDRVTGIEKMVWGAVGGLGLLTIILKFIN